MFTVAKEVLFHKMLSARYNVVLHGFGIEIGVAAFETLDETKCLQKLAVDAFEDGVKWP